MPHVLIETRREYSQAEEVALIEAVHGALRRAFRIPANDRHVRLLVHEPHRFACPPDKDQPDRFTQVSVDAFAGRSLDAKRDLYREIVARLEPMIPEGIAAYGRLCGWTLARAHARSGDCIAIAAYLGKSAAFDRAILEFSRAYAEQNERDYDALSAAVASGRITAETGL